MIKKNKNKKFHEHNFAEGVKLHLSIIVIDHPPQNNIKIFL